MTTLAWIGASVGYVACGLVTARLALWWDQERRNAVITWSTWDFWAPGVFAVLWPLMLWWTLPYALGKLASLGLKR